MQYLTFLIAVGVDIRATHMHPLLISHFTFTYKFRSLHTCILIFSTFHKPLINVAFGIYVKCSRAEKGSRHDCSLTLSVEFEKSFTTFQNLAGKLEYTYAKPQTLL